jgi:capsule polysaccharide modification protein KpsS
MGDFIDEVLRSFSEHAPTDTLLVFKHHPLDRPYSDYTRLIAQRAREFGLSERVHYIHDQHLPTLLRQARGVVTVNSTTGLQALFHGTPVITLGEAVYDVGGLVYGGELDQFWHDPGTVDAALFQAFRNHLVTETQLNASFYADTPGLPAYAMSSSTALSRRLEATSPIPRARPQSAA